MHCGACSVGKPCGMNGVRPQFFNPLQDIAVHGKRLPHWEQAGATYFLTFRLGDSMPLVVLEHLARRRDAWVKRHPPPWSPQLEIEFHRLFSGQVDAWLDKGMGECCLRDPRHREVLEAVLRFSDGSSHINHAWVIMPNHVHALVSLAPDVQLPRQIGKWKGLSSRRINRLMQRRGSLWQDDYFDRLIRDWKHFSNCARYIRGNPIKAQLPSEAYTHFEAAWIGEMIG